MIEAVLLLALIAGLLYASRLLRQRRLARQPKPRSYYFPGAYDQKTPLDWAEVNRLERELGFPETPKPDYLRLVTKVAPFRPML